MVLVQVDYYPELDVAGGVAPLTVGNTRFVLKGPTDRRNEIDSEEWQKIKKLPAISMRLDKGILRLVGGGQIIQPPQQSQNVRTVGNSSQISAPAIESPPEIPQPIQESLFTPSISETTPPEATSTATRKKRGTPTDEATNS